MAIVRRNFNQTMRDKFRILSTAIICGFQLSISAGTVAYYRFEEGTAGQTVTKMLDSGPNHIDGVVDSAQPLRYSTSVVSVAASGKGSLDASGDGNFGRIPHNSAMVLQGSWTVETFAKANQPHGSFGGTTGDPQHYSILTKQNNTGFGNYLAAWSL